LNHLIGTGISSSWPADAFLSKGEIVTLRGRTPGNHRTWQADASELLAGLPQARVEPGRCSAIYQAPDPALSCALAYRQAGNVEGFIARLAR
jgi:hypothetical protein